MLTRWNLWETARARLKDAEVLLQSQRYDGAVYVCGYAIEIALKERICRTLNWSAFPSEKGFGGYRSFKTHDFDILLHLSGVEQKILQENYVDWMTVKAWDPEVRYDPVGSASAAQAETMIQSAKTILETLA
jgi:HEPN domain-containing protein